MGTRRARLNKAGRKLLRKATDGPIGDYFTAASSPLSSDRWIAVSNRYRTHCTDTYWKDNKNQPATINHRHMVQYVAASAPTHVIDGWSFFSRAIEAALRGDTYSAIHFAYYAELRAAMGLLASEGVGVLNEKHPVVTAADKTSHIVGMEELKKGVFKPGGSATTHKFVWPCLAAWSKSAGAEILLNQVIKPGGYDLRTWFAWAGHGGSASPIAQRLLKVWGVDLAATAEDHGNRNLVSYRPSSFRSPPKLEARETISFIEDLWSLFEPGSDATRFPTLELHLLRQAFSLSGVPPPTEEQILDRGIEAQQAKSWATFLSSATLLAPISDARNTSEIEGPRCHLEILSRAAILLFLAAGASRRKLALANRTTDGLAFWWRTFGERRALWDESDAPESPSDAWADIKDDLEDLSAWRERQGGANYSLYTVHQQMPEALRRLSGFEIGSIWGLVP